jgi:hypothetical protein
MVLACQVLLGIFTLAFVFAFVQQCTNPKPQTTSAVFAQMTLLVAIVSLSATIIAISLDPVLTFSPKRVPSFIS